MLSANQGRLYITYFDVTMVTIDRKLQQRCRVFMHTIFLFNFALPLSFECVISLWKLATVGFFLPCTNAHIFGLFWPVFILQQWEIKPKCVNENTQLSWGFSLCCIMRKFMSGCNTGFNAVPTLFQWCQFSLQWHNLCVLALTSSLFKIYEMAICV